jgi:hypothetical protein
MIESMRNGICEQKRPKFRVFLAGNVEVGHGEGVNTVCSNVDIALRMPAERVRIRHACLNGIR